MSTLRLPVRRNDWYRDHDGVLARTKRYDEVLVGETVEFADRLASGETLSSVTTVNAGPTISSAAVSGTDLTYTVTGAGDVTFRVVTSSSQTLEVKVRYRATDQNDSDYQ